MPYHVDLLETDFQPFALLEKRQKITTDVGASSIFIGYMRDFRDDSDVQRMKIAHYPPMTKQHLEQLAKQAVKDFHLRHLYIAHRVGEVYPTSALVVISALASHRGNAIRATETLLEQLKYTAPFWKKEYTAQGSQWVENNTDSGIKF